MSIEGLGFNIDDGSFLDFDQEALQQAREERFAPYGDRLYPYVFTARNDDLETGQGRSSPIIGQSVEMVSAEELFGKFNNDSYAQQTFGSFDNYIGYLDDLLNLAEEHPEIAWWEGYGFSNLTGSNQDFADFYNLEPEDARSGSGARIDASYENRKEAGERFDAMIALPEFQQLVADRGIQTTFNLSGDDVYLFNGLNAAEIYEGNDTFGSYFEQAMGLANDLFIGAALGDVAGVVGRGLGNAANAGMLGDYSSSIAEVLNYAGDADNLSNAIGAASAINAGLDAVDRVENINNRDVTEEEESIVNIGVIDPLLTGDPGDLFEPEIPRIDSPFEGIETPPPENTYTPEFPTTDPQLGLPPQESEGEGEDEGEGGDGAEGNGQNGQGQEGQEGQEEAKAGDTNEQTGEAGEIPDYGDIGDPNYGDDRTPPGERGVIDDYRPRDPGFQIIAGVPFIGNGSGVEGSSGESPSGGGSGGLLSQNKFKFTPYTASIRGVNAPQVKVIGGQPQRQSIMGMFQEYLT